MTDLESILKKKWGYTSFRPLQKEIIQSVLSKRDTIALLPTGAGKSLTYQLPALAMDGVAIIVTPLISLMYDQVKALRDREVNAVYISSGMSLYDVDRILDNCVFGDVKLLYISPERVGTMLFQTRVKRMNVSMVAVDEAHCISQWGYNFRPSYLNIWHLRELLPDVPFLALTATATKMVVSDISSHLMLNNPNVFVSSFERKNIRFVVRSTDDKKSKLLEIISVLPASWTGIVYCRTRTGTVDVSDFLSGNGVTSDFYHAGLDSKSRNMKQKSWMDGRARVIVATSAFGMGIDKSNVRFVVHYDMPDTIEEYYQQAGRAGRDGKDSFAVVLYSEKDISNINRRVMDEFPSLDVVKKVYDLLCRFLEIPFEYGQNVVKQFSLFEFCKYSKIYSSKVIASLKILQSNGYLTYYEENERPTRIQFEVSRDALYNFTIENEYDDIVIAALLRNYEGLFTRFTPINEQFLSHITGIEEENIPAVLIRLSRQHILKYIPRNSEPVVKFDLARVSIDSIFIAPETYIVRRNNLSLMTCFVKEYLLQKTGCRMQLLCNYFDQDNVTACGHCDICCTTKSHVVEDVQEAIAPQTRKEVCSAIIRELQSKGQSNSMEELSNAIPYGMFDILLALRELLWKKEVYEMPDGKIRLRVS